MKKLFLAASVAAASLASAAFADGHGITVGVSWSNFQEERWKTDEAAIKGALDAAGAKYISADAQSSAAKQLTDIEALIAQGADALIILAQDKDAIGPALDAAEAEGVPMIGYDRLIEDERTFYLTFDNKGVGRIIAQSVTAAQPEGNFAIIKGDKGDPNAGFLLEGMMEVIADDVASGHFDAAGRGRENAGEHPHRRRFTRAIRSDQAQDFMFFHVKAYIIYCHQTAEALGDVIDFQKCATCCHDRILSQCFSIKPANPWGMK